jgi:hypothetical protein
MEKIRISFRNAAGDYYYATQSYTGAWTVATTPTLTYLQHLPKNWDDGTMITWQRNMDYGGVFRSMSDTYVFAMDARAILQSLMFGGGGVNAYCLMTIYQWNETTFTYDVLYPSEIDFTKYKDDGQLQQLSIGTLDNGLLKYFESKRGVKFNIPFWTYDGASWNTDAQAVRHDGCKLYWEGNWVTAASATFPIAPATTSNLLYTWNRGSVSDGRHWIPIMNTVNPVRNNGTTTYIGNDILEPYMPILNQPYNYNRNFEGAEDIRAYTTNSCLFKDMLPNPSETDVVEAVLTLDGKFNGNITYNNVVAQDQFVAIVLFEIGEDDLPVMSGGNYQYTLLYSQTLPNGGSPYTPPASGVFSVTTNISLNFKKAYVLGIIYDGVTSGLSGQTVGVSFSDLRLTASSLYNSGTSTPVDAPALPPQTIVAFTPMQVFEKLMSVLDSTETDAYGFPVPTNNYTAASSWLTDSIALADNLDLTPKDLYFTSENVLRDVRGIPYLTISLQGFFDLWNRISMCGLGLNSATELQIENMAGYFDDTTEIMDLGGNIEGLYVKPYTNIMGNDIKAGYGDMQTNADFGGDNYNFGQEYSLPLDTMPKTLDLSVSYIAEINQIEKMRQQANNSQQSASSTNNVVLLQIDPSVTSGQVILNPEGGSEIVTAVHLKKYSTAQSTSSVTFPYINGMRYPDTAYNLGITPAHNIIRYGAWLRSLCDGQDATGKITYQKQYQQSYNDASAPMTSLPGISTYLDAARLINEVADIDLNSLDNKLFRPYIYGFKTQYPVNMYSLINSSPYGYVKFTGRDGIERKGFLYKVEQSAGNNAATDMELIAIGTTTDAELIVN